MCFRVKYADQQFSRILDGNLSQLEFHNGAFWKQSTCAATIPLKVNRFMVFSLSQIYGDNLNFITYFMYEYNKIID